MEILVQDFKVQALNLCNFLKKILRIQKMQKTLKRHIKDRHERKKNCKLAE